MNKLFALLAITQLILGCGESSEREAMLYNAWIKAHPKYNISQEEWQGLREEYLLPGQSIPCDDSGDVAIGAMMGLTSGMAAGSSMR